MNPRFLPLRTLMLVVLTVLIATGCSSMRGMFKDKQANEGVAVETLYERAHGQMRNRNWSGAMETYRRLIAQYPYGPYTEQAMVETAYAQYKMGAHDEAISTIDRFLRTYPTHRNTAYMYYLRGLTNASRNTVFLQRVWRLDAARRELSAPMQAYNDFNIVATRFPNTRYAEDAQARMADLRNLFARNEIETALYYLRRGAWVAAVNRAQYLNETYPNSVYQHDAVAVMAEAYTRLGNDALAAGARAELQRVDPSHAWLQGRNWPNYPWPIRKLNPFAGERSVVGH